MKVEQQAYSHVGDRDHSAELWLSYQAGFSQQTLQEHLQRPSWSLQFRSSTRSSLAFNENIVTVVHLYLTVSSRTTAENRLHHLQGFCLVHFIKLFTVAARFLLINASCKSSSGCRTWNKSINSGFSGEFRVPWWSQSSSKGFSTRIIIHSSCEE